jgi:hypothetical protein
MIVAIDFDLTIVDASGGLIDGAKDAINQLHADGHYIIIWTSRVGDSLAEAIQLLNDNDIAFDKVNENMDGIANDPRKVIADCYIDDKNINGIPAWSDILNILTPTRSMKTRNHNPNRRDVFGSVRAFDINTAKESRTIPFVFSNANRDRHGTILNQANWQLDNFNANPIAGYMHNVYGGDLCTPPNPDDVIGKARAWVEGGQLLGEITFEPAEINPTAEKVFQKLLFGSLNSVSVGFMEIGQGRWGEGEEAQRGSTPTYYFEGQELLEISVVNIPSNATAGRRNMRDQAYNAIMYVKRNLGNDYSFADIESMTVANVLRLLDGEPVERETPPPSENEEFNAAKRRHIFRELNKNLTL